MISPAYSPTCPQYDDEESAGLGSAIEGYAMRSPAYSPTSPQYDDDESAELGSAIEEMVSDAENVVSRCLYSPTCPQYYDGIDDDDDDDDDKAAGLGSTIQDIFRLANKDDDAKKLDRDMECLVMDANLDSIEFPKLAGGGVGYSDSVPMSGVAAVPVELNTVNTPELQNERRSILREYSGSLKPTSHDQSNVEGFKSSAPHKMFGSPRARGKIRSRSNQTSYLSAGDQTKADSESGDILKCLIEKSEQLSEQAVFFSKSSPQKRGEEGKKKAEDFLMSTFANQPQSPPTAFADTACLLKLPHTPVPKPWSKDNVNVLSDYLPVPAMVAPPPPPPLPESITRTSSRFSPSATAPVPRPPPVPAVERHQSIPLTGFRAMASAMPAQKRHRKAFASPPPSLSAPLPGGTALPPPLPSRAPTTPLPPPPSRAPTTPPPPLPSRAPTTPPPPLPSRAPTTPPPPSRAPTTPPPPLPSRAPTTPPPPPPSRAPTTPPPPLPSRAPTTPPPPPPSRAPTTPPPPLPSRAPTTTTPPPPAPTATPAAATAPAPGRQLQSLQKDLSFSRLTLEDYAVFPDSMVDSGQEALAPAVAVRKSQSSPMKKKLKPESKVMKGGFMAKCVVTEPPQNAAVSAKSPPEKGIDMVFGSSRQQSSVSSVMECLGGLSSPAPSLLENIRVGGIPLKKAEKILTPEPQGSKSKDAVVTELDEHVVLTAMSPPEKEINLSMASASGQDPSSVQAWACLSQESIPAGKNLMKTRKLRRRPPAMNTSSPALSDSQPKLRKESPQLLKASEVISSSRMNRGRASIVHRKVMSDVPKNRVVLDSALLPHMETTDETPTKVTGLETRFRCVNFKTFDNIFKVQRSDGSWEFCDHLFVALMIDYMYDACRNKLYSAGLKSLGCRVEEAMLSLTATAIVLGQFLFFLLPVQFMELDFSNFLHDIESIDVDKARDEIRKKLDGHTDKSAAVYDLVMCAVRFCEETVAAHPMVCSQLELGRNWDYFLADINGFIRNKASIV